MHARKPELPQSMSEPDLRLVDEAMLIDNARADPDAFASIYQQYAGPVYRMCLRAVGDPDMADDLTATVFLTLIERLDRYQARPGSTFRSWLFVITRNIVHDHWRRTNRVSPIGDGEVHLPDLHPGPDEIAIHRMEMAEIRGILESLNDRQRTVVEYRLSGLTTKEIAAAMNISISALKSTQTRAYANIRLRLSEKGSPQ